MRRALKILALPVALIVASAVGAIGSWAMPLGAVLLFGACVVSAVVMESQDLAAVEGLSTAEARSASDPLLEAA